MKKIGKLNLSNQEHGLKIHISLNDEMENNIANGWNAIAGILQFYNIARTKVVRQHIEKDSDLPSYKHGKQITIYASLNVGDWSKILCAITKSLSENGVKPGYKPDSKSSETIDGNDYISYRYDWDPKTEKYRGARNLDGAFPQGVEDTLKKTCASINWKTYLVSNPSSKTDAMPLPYSLPTALPTRFPTKEKEKEKEKTPATNLARSSTASLSLALAGHDKKAAEKNIKSSIAKLHSTTPNIPQIQPPASSIPSPSPPLPTTANPKNQEGKEKEKERKRKLN